MLLLLLPPKNFRLFFRGIEMQPASVQYIQRMSNHAKELCKFDIGLWIYILSFIEFSLAILVYCLCASAFPQLHKMTEDVVFIRGNK